MDSSASGSIAVIGGGAAGCAAAWMLQTAGIGVELFEAQPRLGGHAHTATYVGHGQMQDVDLGDIWLSAASHPITKAFLKYYNTSTTHTNLSVASEINGERWSTGVDSGKISEELHRFETIVKEQYQDADNLLWSFEQWLDRNDFSKDFYHRVLLPNLVPLFLTPDGIQKSALTT
eukprot:SAG31_NODE_7392_length_1701_cov_3.198502_2_plen_175_part_00